MYKQTQGQAVSRNRNDLCIANNMNKEMFQKCPLLIY